MSSKGVDMLSGVITALITPFDEKGNIDFKAFEKILEMQIDAGVSGLLPLGTTAESPVLSEKEKEKIIEMVLNKVRGRIPVIAGSGSNSTEAAIKATIKMKEMGVDSSLQVAPYYNKPSQEGLYRHFSEIVEKCDFPIWLYNVPGRSGVEIATETISRLSKDSRILGVKDATGNVSAAMEVLKDTPEEFSVFSGDDALTLPMMSLGARGIISVVSNLVPEKMVKFTRLIIDGNYMEARNMHYELLPLFKAAFIETNPVPIKAAMASKGWMKEEYRSPLCNMQEENRKKLMAVVESF